MRGLRIEEEMIDKYIDVNGYKIRYWDEGRGKKTIVFLHGLASAVEYWEKNIPVFAKQYRVVALDMLGFGASDKPKINYTHETLVKFLKDFLGALQIKKCVLVGHSLGGGVALAFAEEYPEKVSQLILVSSAGFYRKIPWIYRVVTLPFVGECFFKPHSIETTEKFIKQFARQKHQITRAFVIKMHSMHQSKEYFRIMLNIMRQFITISGVKRKLLEKVKVNIRHLTMPVLIIWGRNDRLLTVRGAYEAKKLLPEAELEIIEHCGHMPQLEHPEKFNQRVLAFLTDLPI